jgi:hypothetical protein
VTIGPNSSVQGQAETGATSSAASLGLFLTDAQEMSFKSQVDHRTIAHVSMWLTGLFISIDFIFETPEDM